MMVSRVFFCLCRISVFLFLLVAALWTCGVVYFCLPGGCWLVYVYMIILAGGVVFRKYRMVQAGAAVLFAGLAVYYICIPATNDRPWLPSWSRLPEGRIDGNRLELKNIRDFRYRTTYDFDVRYVTETYDLDKLVSLDFAVSHWDGLEAISHTMLSFGFSDGRYLAVSAETRLASGAGQGALPGLFKRFGFIYIFAREEDIWSLRTNYRGEDMYLYRLNTTPEKLKIILTDFIERANRLHAQPEFYNTLTHNCTTGLMPPLKKVSPVIHYNPTVLLNGFIDQRAYRKGALLHREGEGFEELKRRSLIPHSLSLEEPELYSRRIREHVGIPVD